MPTQIAGKKFEVSDCDVTNHRSIYAIGYGSKQVTIYSQQVRALRLIFALQQQGFLFPKAEMVVVGAGIAGLTAAAAAALCGAHVTVLEQAEELLHLQRGCHTRYLHPRIY